MLSIFNSTYQKPSIWAFDEAATRRQIIFDFIFGIITPILCFACDPLVICGWFTNGRDVLPHGGALYIFSGVAISLLLIRLFFKSKSTNLNGISAGVFYAGALFSLLVGIILLPISILLGFVVIGGIIESVSHINFSLKDLAFSIMLISLFVLSLTPMLTAFAYWRNGSRAAGIARENISGAHLKGLALSAVISLVSISFFSQLKIENETKKAVAAIIQSSDGRNDNAVVKLKILSWTPNFSRADLDSLIMEAQKTENAERQENLAQSYQEITGKSVAERMKKPND